MVTGTIIYDKITAVSSGVTEAIFEKAGSGDSEVENPQTEDPEANSRMKMEVRNQQYVGCWSG